MARWTIRSLIISALMVALGAQASEASSVSVAGGVMTITANPGEANDVRFGAAGSDERGPLVRVIDSGSEDIQPGTSSDRRIVAGGSCNQSSDGTDAFCPTDGLTRVVVNLGDEDDEYDGSTMQVNTELDLGPGTDTGMTDRGSDVLRGGTGPDTLEGGGTGSASGALDTFEGGAGTDTFNLRRSGPDVVSGGPDSDTVTYASRFSTVGTTGVTVTLDDVANDGVQSPLERDNIGSDVEKVVGSGRNDALRGSTGPNILEGGLGRDSFTGNGGGDDFRLRDGVQDNSFCVNRNDTVDKDLQDPVNFPCSFLSLREGIVLVNIFTGAVDEGPNVRIASRALRIRPGGRVRVALRCPARLPRGCRGRLTLREPTRAARRLGRSRYRLRSGRRRAVTVTLGARAQRRALRRGAVALEAIEKGQHGLKSTYAFRDIR
jgi:hemolysin type calcium-binding protein